MHHLLCLAALIVWAHFCLYAQLIASPNGNPTPSLLVHLCRLWVLPLAPCCALAQAPWLQATRQSLSLMMPAAAAPTHWQQ